jgi:hypothetical protein
MASFKSTYLCNLYLNALYNGAAFDSVIPATIYAVAFTVAPTVAGGGTEWTDAGISRVAKTCNTTNFPTATAASISNATSIAFGTPISSATIVGVGWMDASSGGNLLDYGDLDAPKAATAGVAFTLPIGAFVGTEA